MVEKVVFSYDSWDGPIFVWFWGGKGIIVSSQTLLRHNYSFKIMAKS